MTMDINREMSRGNIGNASAGCLPAGKYGIDVIAYAAYNL